MDKRYISKSFFVIPLFSNRAILRVGVDKMLKKFLVFFAVFILLFSPFATFPVSADIDPDEDNALGTNWTASEEYGSPGTVNTAFLSQKGQEWIPEKFQVYNNYPNPFNPRTTIHYDLNENGIVNITIYDMIGRQVVILTNDYQLAGYSSIQWNSVNDFGQPVPAGVYLYTVRGKGFSQTRKMLLLK